MYMYTQTHIYTYIYIYMSNDGLKYGPKLVTLKCNFGLHDRTFLNTCIYLSTTGLCQLKVF